jgi:hypothetical protein
MRAWRPTACLGARGAGNVHYRMTYTQVQGNTPRDIVAWYE